MGVNCSCVTANGASNEDAETTLQEDVTTTPGEEQQLHWNDVSCGIPYANIALPTEATSEKPYTACADKCVNSERIAITASALDATAEQPDTACADNYMSSEKETIIASALAAAALPAPDAAFHNDRLIGSKLRLVRKEEKFKHAVFKHSAALASKSGGIELTLQGSTCEGLAVVALTENINAPKMKLTYCELGIGLVKHALHVTYNGAYMWRDQDKHSLLVHDGKVLAFKPYKQKENHIGTALTINDDGTISPAEDSRFVLGISIRVFLLGTRVVITTGQYSDSKGLISTGPDPDGRYQVALQRDGEEIERVMVEGFHLQLDNEFLSSACTRHPQWNQARPLTNNELSILSESHNEWQIQQLAKARSALARIGEAASWQGDVVNFPYTGLGPDKSCDLHIKLYFPGDGRVKVLLKARNWPMGLTPCAAVLAPPDGLANLPFVNLVHNIHKFSRNDGVVNVRVKLPLLSELDNMFSWAMFDLIDESEAGVLAITEPLEKDVTEFWGFAVPPVIQSALREYKESPDDMLATLGVPSAKLGHTDWILFGTMRLPFPRWMLPTATMRLVFRTVLNFILGQIGDKLVLSSSDKVPDELQHANEDLENFFAMLKPRFARAEAKARRLA